MIAREDAQRARVVKYDTSNDISDGSVNYITSVRQHAKRLIAQVSDGDVCALCRPKRVATQISP